MFSVLSQWISSRRNSALLPKRRKHSRHTTSRKLNAEALEDRLLLSATQFFGLSGGGTVLSRFDDFGDVSNSTAIAGLGADTLVDIDFFTSGDGQLYGMGSSGTLYTINTATAAATVDVAPPYGAVDIGTPTAIDFNPAADRLRIFSGVENFRLTPGTGVATDDGLLVFAAGDVNEGDTPNLRAAAYTNNFDAPGGTTLYSIDVDQNALILHTGGPQFSTLTTVAGLTLDGSAFDIGANVGFDIFTNRSDPTAAVDFAYVSNGNDLYEITLTGAGAGELFLLGTVDGSVVGLTDITANPGTIVFGSALDDTLIVTATSEDTGTYSLNGGGPVAFIGIHAFTFNAQAGSDILRIINPAGSLFALSDGIFFAGQDGPTDRLELEGGGGASFNQDYEALGADAGIYTTADASIAQSISFSGVENLQDTVEGTQVNVLLPNVANNVTVQAGISAINGDFPAGIVTTGVGDGVGGTFADLAVANKTELVVNGQGGSDNFTFQGATLGEGATEFEFVGGAGVNRAYLNGSTASDTAQLDPTSGTFFSSDYFVSARDVAEFYVQSGGGPNERADLFDSIGDDRFVSFPTFFNLRGAGFRNEVAGFDSVYAFASTGNDRAELHDSDGDDILSAFPTFANLRGPGFRNEAIDFDFVFSIATAGGTDRADLFGSAGNDTFFSSPAQAYLYSSAYYNSAAGFDAVYATGGSGGFDVADLFGSSTEDFFFGSSGFSNVSGNGFRNEAVAFDQVFSHAAGSADRAELLDSTGNDLLFGRGDRIELSSGATYFFRLDGLDAFDRVAAFSSNGGVDTSDVESIDYNFQQTGPWVNA